MKRTPRRQTQKDGIRITPPRFAEMQCGGKAAAQILDDNCRTCSLSGRPTGAHRRVITQMVETQARKSATIGYKGYQHAAASLEPRRMPRASQVDKKLKDGTILNIDVTVIVEAGLAILPDVCRSKASRK